ncbi:hypothetical protein [Streptomyces sp. NBC_00038]|uniref:hypothetical protein n=1 Tax=Streptomyces sp. NBC_00038 TaxID=2903615 RepID=UPI0022513EE3|nr:hypothetical protein [Streptomyces sp. NBC_00038]MCX5555393.1 hypothetical protein [Streptomyces sp. NBC_00038]
MRASATVAPESDDGAALLSRQESRQEKARTVLDTLKPLQRWERCGEPRLCGAMSYDLLVAPDIDIEIFGDLRVDAGFSLVSDWARDPAVDRVLFINAVGEPDAGLGWELHYRLDGVRWAVQMWLLPTDYEGPRSADLVAPMRAALCSTTRSRILHIKEALVARKAEYRSIDVYRAVLDHGVKGVEEYNQWCRSYSSTGLLNWSPAPLR